MTNGLTAIGSGGLLGHGFNNTPLYFPEMQTDFIFAVFASNFGFIGVIILLALIIYFDINIIKLGRKSYNNNDKLLSYMILIGMLFNISNENLRFKN